MGMSNPYSQNSSCVPLKILRLYLVYTFLFTVTILFSSLGETINGLPKWSPKYSLFFFAVLPVPQPRQDDNHPSILKIHWLDNLHRDPNSLRSGFRFLAVTQDLLFSCRNYTYVGPDFVFQMGFLAPVAICLLPLLPSLLQTFLMPLVVVAV